MQKQRVTKLFVATVLVIMMMGMLLMAVQGQTSRDHLVTSLPGFNEPITFKSYTGYLNGNTTQHHLFYWFMECTENPATAPVVLWTNGGPGCSSIDGMVSEHGPFVVLADGKTVVSNPFAWNKRVNMIYLEQPIGVGFSYSDKSADYNSINDITAANDMNGAMRDFFSRFPQYVNNPFYISGESYGGVYVPSAALRILQGNQQGELPKINLQGIMVGNGVTDGEEDANSVPLFYKEHSLITIEDYNDGFIKCKGNFYANQNSADCSAFLSKVYASLTHLNPYYIYDSCTWLGDNGLNMPKRSINSKNHPLFQLFTQRATSRRSSFSIVGDESDSPCVPDHSIISYFNQPIVRSAIGATHIGNPNGWQVCSTFINYTTIYTTMLPFYTKLLPQIRVLVYSGDVDTTLNTLGTQAGINKLGLTVSHPYSQWLHNDVNGHPVVDGFYKKYSNGKGLTFVTVRGAGHMVPQTRAASALRMLTNFLNDKW